MKNDKKLKAESASDNEHLTNMVREVVLKLTNSDECAFESKDGPGLRWQVEVIEIEQLNTTAKAVIFFFRDEPYKAILWFITDNPMLGGISPMAMIETGRHEKVIEFVRVQMLENGVGP